MKCTVLILEEFGLEELNEAVRLALLETLEDRHRIKLMIVISQLPVSSWNQFIGEPTTADAITDCMAFNIHRIELKDESVRRKMNTLY
jgi:DNA replication protein DnaC